MFNLNGTFGITPEIAGYLASIKEFEYSYKYYNLRHPGGIYNLTTNYILNDFIDLLNELKEHQADYKKDRAIKLEKKFRDLINNFFKFYDSCFELMQGCCNQHTPPQEKEFLYKWLERNNYDVGKEFHDKTKNEIDYFRKIYNKLKHSSNAIQPINFHVNNSAIMGYYIQSASPDGSLGPDEELHPKHQNTHSANSYNFSLRRLYYLIYFVSEKLKEVLLKHFQDVYSITLVINLSHKHDDKLWKDLFERIDELPNSYFPNEFGKDIPETKIEKNKFVFKIKPAETTNLYGSQITFMESGDGFTRSFRMPFFNPKL